MTVVFDTNVVVSALVFRGGACAPLRRVWSTGEVVPVVSRAMVDELVRVLAYPKLRLSGDDRLELLGDYLPFVKQLGPEPPRLMLIPTLPFGTLMVPLRRGARVVESGGLEIRCAALRYRGFESLPLRNGLLHEIGIR